MVCFTKPPSESKICVADGIKQIASGTNVRIENSIAVYFTADICVGAANIYMKPAEYYIIVFENLKYIVEHLEYIRKHLDFMETIKKVIGNARIALCVYLSLSSSNLSGKTSCLQQRPLSPASYLDNSHTGFEKHGDEYREEISSKINKEWRNEITMNTNRFDYIKYDEYAVKMKQYNAPVEDLKFEDAQNQDEIPHAEIKMDNSQDHPYVQTVEHLPPGDRNRSPNYRSESSNRSGSPSTQGRLLSSYCSSTSTEIKQMSTSGEWTNCRNYSAEPSPDISSSQKGQLYGGTKDSRENGNLKSDLLVVGMTECDSACEVDIALGHKCGSEPDIKADVQTGAGENTYRKRRFSMCRHVDCGRDNALSETEDGVCFIETPDDCKRSDQLYACTCRSADCDRANESVETYDVKWLNESIDSGKKNEAGDAVEQDMRSISTNIYNNGSLKDGKYCKQSAKNNIRSRIIGRTPNSVSQTTPQLRHLSTFDNISSSPLYDNDFGEKYFIKGKTEAAVRREAEVTSPRDCTCLCPDTCFLHKTVSRFGAKNSLGQHLEGSLALRLLTKFDPVRHMPWRNSIQVFHLPSSVAPSNLYIFMNFEVFRLSSFDFRKFPKGDSIFVTSLAKSGFYFETETVQIVCFGCRHKFQGPRDCLQSSVNSFHSSLCTRDVLNKPIDQWIQGLHLDALTDYFMRNGSLTPYLDETPPAVGQSSRTLTPKNILETKQFLDLSQASTVSYSSGYQSEDIPFVEPERETHSYPQLLDIDSSCTNPFQLDYPSPINHSYSLPSNLNSVSGVVVCEERPQPNGTHSVLTSAAKLPLLYTSQDSHNAEGTHDIAEEGAVGGILQLSLDGAAYPQFSIEAVRRKSFTAWSSQHTHRPEDLAVAGFFYAGYSDCVRCFYCGLGLKYWRPADIPAYQHAKHRPSCSFNILFKGQDYVDRVQQELRSEQATTNIVDTQTAPQQPIEHEQRSITAQAAVDPQEPQEPDYLSSEAAQEALANGWTRDQVGQAVSHIVRVYGESCLEIELLTDILIHLNTSYQLNQGLPRNGPASSNASETNPSVSEVTTSYPSSVQLVNALASGQNGQERPEDNHRTQEEVTLVRTPHSEQPEARVPDFRDILTSVEREHSLLEERVTCRVCKSRPVSCIYLPCGHVIACQECSDNATHCVFCRKAIIGTANVYLA